MYFNCGKCIIKKLEIKESKEKNKIFSLKHNVV